jgi:hypothetical protein
MSARLIERGAIRLPGRREHPHDRKPVLRREGEVALVMSRHRHDRAGAVLHEHVVGDPDRDALAGRGIDRVTAGEDAGLFLVADLPRDDVLLRGGQTVGLDLRLFRRRGERVDQRMLRLPGP